MRKKKRCSTVAVLPAFNAQRSLGGFLKKFPFELFDQVILVDDFSSDDTYKEARKFRMLQVFRNSRNLGYGGNLKVCLGRGVEAGADVIVEIHPDGEYGFDGIEPALKEVERGAKLVLGNRFEVGPKGMAAWKIPFTRLLTRVGNSVLGIEVKDLHQGFRVYTRELLEEIPYKNASNNYIFSFEIIAQAALQNLKISSVPVSSFYKGRKRGASLKSSIVYSLGVFRVLGQYLLSRMGMKQEIFDSSNSNQVCRFCGNSFLVKRLFKKDGFEVFWCDACLSGFTFPEPKRIEDYYPENYWGGGIKRLIFRVAQARRLSWVRGFYSGGRVVDVGSGEGEFGRDLKEFQVLSMESKNSKVQNPEVLKRDFLRFNPKEKFEAITFWESLEHVSKPQGYLRQARKLLKKEGKVFIEYPRFDSIEARIFKRHWFHLDLPRHLSHFSEEGLRLIAEREGYKVIKKSGVWAPEYNGFGFFSSVMSGFGFPVDRFKNNLAIYILFSPLIILSFLFELFFYTINQSPIGLMVLKKNELHKKS